MKELFEKLSIIPVEQAQNLNLLDTCFFIHSLESQKHIEKLEKLGDKAMTSFNVEELLKVEHRLDDNIKHNIRKFLKNNKLIIVNIDVHPGNKDKELNYVNAVDKDLLKFIPDPSDAVLIACAIATKSNVFTRDKHHLYTTKLENFLRKYGIEVFNKII